MAKRKKSRNRKVDNAESSNGDIKAIAYISIGVLLAIAMYSDLAGALSIFSKAILYKLFGLIAYFIPIYLVFLGIDTIKAKGSIKYTRRVFAIILIMVSLNLFCGTIKLNSMEVTTFGNTLMNIMKQKHFSLHGGVLGYFITYPLSKFIGYVGSYLLYITLIFIGVVLVFDITLYDIYLFFNNKVSNSIGKNKTKEGRNKKDDMTLPLASSNVEDIIVQEENAERDDYIKGINNKIQILDFMKNSELEDRNPLMDISLEALDMDDEVYETSIDKPLKDKVNKQAIAVVNDVVNKEIEESISDKSDIVKRYVFPDMELLKVNSKTKLKNGDKKDLLDNANKLEATLRSFGVEAKVLQVTKGPTVTRFELQPSPGVKVSKIVNLQDDIALGLAANGVRMEAPIPGKSAIGIEVPNERQSPVFLREVLDSKEFSNTDKNLAFALGKDIAGKCIVGDLSKMPHMLIAGATGSGKSVCINSLIISLLYKYSPKEVRLLMVDPKVVELSVYNGIPHLLIPVVTDPKKAAGALNWAVNEMNKRYNLFKDLKVKNIESYNSLFEKGIIEEKLPYIVLIVDELADLMMACPNDVEDYICRLAQMARAAGMHLIIATQRPSVDVITGVIKANIPSRVSFAVSSGIDSRTILDQVGAEKLLGRGDMLYNPIGESKPLRVQGAFISEEEVENVVNFIKESDDEIDYKKEIMEHINNESSSVEEKEEDSSDELINDAIKLVIEYQQASTSFLQRKLRVGFNRASRIMDELEERGIISEKDGSRQDMY
jgi:S-DNA-T family DNA segregation ATPase FtsK/SpoIIIE